MAHQDSLESNVFETQEKDVKYTRRVPVIEISKESGDDTWSAAVGAIRGATYVALDLELSGLGNRARLTSRLADDRYKHLCEVAVSYSVLSCGLCCCTLSEQSSAPSNMQLSCSTFNILLHCQKPYLIEPQAVQFLLSHGFDFNKQYSCGLPYWPGDINKGKELKNYQGSSYDIGTLFGLLIALRKPIVLHNGLVDLVFFYQAFYTELPANLATFTADLSEIFAGGIYDTKTIAVFEEHEHATYLEYIFRKSQRDNSGGQDATKFNFVDIQFTKPTNCEKWTEMIGYEVHRRQYTSSLDLCPYYVKWGFCGKREKCEHIHDVDLLLDKLEQQAANKRRKNRRSQKRKRMSSDVKDTVQLQPSQKKLCEETPLVELFSDELAVAKLHLASDGQSNNKDDDELSAKVHFSGHRAGFDAFMTAYSFAVYLCKKKIKSNNTEKEAIKHETVSNLAEMESIKNKIVMSGRPLPLLLAKSHFAKTSLSHQLRMTELLKYYSPTTDQNND